MLQKQNSSWPLLPFSQMQQLPSVISPIMPIYIDYPDPILINYESGSNLPGPPGPPGPAGPQGPAGSLANVPVTLIDQPTYTATTAEYFLGVIYNGMVTITLPAGTLGKVFVVKDSVGDANTNPITITTTSSTIDGITTYVLDLNWGSIGLVYNGIEWNVV